MEHGMPPTMLGRVAEVLRAEAALYGALVRWVLRRRDVPPGSVAVGYSQLVGPTLWLWIAGSAVEVVAVEVVLRQIDTVWSHAARVPLLVLGIWGVLWMTACLAAQRVRPHLLADERLTVRNGARTWVDVPLHAVSTTAVVEHDLPSSLRSFHQDDDVVLVGVSGRTNLQVTLDGPTRLATSRGDLVASRVGLWVDDPRAVAARLRDQRDHARPDRSDRASGRG